MVPTFFSPSLPIQLPHRETTAHPTQACDRSEDFLAWLRARVHFHNSMVDRITSHRAGAPEVPRAEGESQAYS